MAGQMAFGGQRSGDRQLAHLAPALGRDSAPGIQRLVALVVPRFEQVVVP